MTNQASEPPAAPSVGRYRLLRKIGEGGMGAVYEAEHTRLRKRVALKVLPPAVARDGQAVARFEREMQAVGRLDHPGIVRAMDADEAGGVAYLAMELVDGLDARRAAEWCERRGAGRVPEGAAGEIVRQAAVALHHAHERGLIHRDLKPSNLMLSRAGRVKVLDLGLASLDGAAEEADDPLTGSGQIMGTVDYMAPEQAAATRGVDARADVYALGATLYRLLSGRPPWPPNQYPSLAAKLTALAVSEPPPLSEVWPEAPSGLTRAVAAAMAKDPDARTPTAAALAEAVAPFADAAALASLAAEMPRTEVADASAVTRDLDPEGTAAASMEATHLQAVDAETRTLAAPGAGAAATDMVPTRSLTDSADGRTDRRFAGVAVAAACLAVVGAAAWWAARAEPDPRPPAVADAPAVEASPAVETSPAVELPASSPLPAGLDFAGRAVSFADPNVEADFSSGVTLEAWIDDRPGEAVPLVDGLTKETAASFGPLNLSAAEGDWTARVSMFDAGRNYGVSAGPAPRSPGRRHLAAVWSDEGLRLYDEGRAALTERRTWDSDPPSSEKADIEPRRRAADAFVRWLADDSRTLRLGPDAWADGEHFSALSARLLGVRVSPGVRYDGPFRPPPPPRDDEGAARAYDLSGLSGPADGRAELFDAGGRRAFRSLAAGAVLDAGLGLQVSGASAVRSAPLDLDLSGPLTLEAWLTPLIVTGEDAGPYLDAMGKHGPWGLYEDRTAAALGPLRLKFWRRDAQASVVEDRGQTVAGVGVGGRQIRVAAGRADHWAAQSDGRSLRLFIGGEDVTYEPFAFGELDDPEGFVARVLSEAGGRPRLVLGNVAEPWQERPSPLRGWVGGVRLSRGLRYDGPFEPPRELTADDSTVLATDFAAAAARGQALADLGWETVGVTAIGGAGGDGGARP